MPWHATGSLTAHPALEHPELLATPVVRELERAEPDWARQIGVAEIDPALADTAEFCARYGDVVIGSGMRASKLFVPGALLAALPHAEVLEGLGRPIA